eukprot:scaffold665601_cov59-Prasinocladus_malaysianus.AAC.1
MLGAGGPIPPVSLSKQRSQGLAGRMPSGALPSSALKVEEARGRKAKDKKRRHDSLSIDTELDVEMSDADKKRETPTGKKGKKAK